MTMSVEAGKVAEQNSALLSFLAGPWTTRFFAYVHSDLGVATGIRMRTHLGGANVRGLYKPLPDGSIAGHYMPIDNSARDDDARVDRFLQLELDRSDNALIAYLGNDQSVPGIRGVWSNSVLHFRGDFHDGITMWELFQAARPQVTARPLTVSLIVRQASESSWLLDVAFKVKQSYPSHATPVGLRCRLEFWHFRQRPSASMLLHPLDVEESFDEILQRCDEVTQDVELRLDEIDDLIASLEDNRAKCEERLRLLGELKANAEGGKKNADDLNDDVAEAILELHENGLASTEGSAVADKIETILTGTSSVLDSLQTDTESLETELDSIEVDIDFPDDDLIGSVWTNAEYARGKRLLQENRSSLPPPDLSFLGPLEYSVSKLSKVAAMIVKTTSVLVQAALRGEPLAELDYGPQVASMAKACERIIADVFKEKKEAIERDPVVGSLFSDEPSWQYSIPASMPKVTSNDLRNVARMVKKSIGSRSPAEVFRAANGRKM
jgi:hypothetical protein